MHINKIFAELKKPFPPEDHLERYSLNGSKWFYIPWTKIRDRLDKVCPNWQVSYSDPIAVSDYIVVRCKLTIAGITREATGDDKAYLQVNDNGTLKSMETPTERAMSNAFANAAEQFGIGSYLSDREFVWKYLEKYHSSKAATIQRVNQRRESREVAQLLRNLQKRPPLQPNVRKLPSFEVRGLLTKSISSSLE